jgi:hypothetical protein
MSFALTFSLLTLVNTPVECAWAINPYYASYPETTQTPDP